MNFSENLVDFIARQYGFQGSLFFSNKNTSEIRKKTHLQLLPPLVKRAMPSTNHRRPCSDFQIIFFGATCWTTVRATHTHIQPKVAATEYEFVDFPDRFRCDHRLLLRQIANLFSPTAPLTLTKAKPESKPCTRRKALQRPTALVTTNP